MQKSVVSLGLFSLGLYGCQSQQQLVDSIQPDALQVAQKRGAFELDLCAEGATSCAGGAHNNTQ